MGRDRVYGDNDRIFRCNHLDHGKFIDNDHHHDDHHPTGEWVFVGRRYHHVA